MAKLDLIDLIILEIIREITERRKLGDFQDFRENGRQPPAGNNISASNSMFTFGELRETVMGDRYDVSGRATVGPNPRVHHVSFQYLWGSLTQDVDQSSYLKDLSRELEELRIHLRGQAESRQEDAELAEIGAAATAAEKGDGPRALSHLAHAGKWALEAATMIGSAIAAAAIRTATGLP